MVALPVTLLASFESVGIERVMSPNDSVAAPKPRSPIVAVLLSGVFPGLGQLYNRQPLKALLFGGVSAVLGFGPMSPLTVDIEPGDPAAGLTRVLLTSVPFLVVALWSVLDAYRVAQRSQPAARSE